MKIVLLGWLCLLVSAAGAEDAPAKRWEIIAVGDIMLGRGVAKKIEQQGSSYPFSHLRLVTDSCQVLCGNLESVISSEEFKSISPYRFKADPVVASNILKQNGFGFLSVANNHAYDCGPAGLEASLAILDSLQIPFSGILAPAAGPDSALDPAVSNIFCRPAYLQIGAIRVGFLAFCQPYLLYPNNERTIIAPADSATVFSSIQAAKDSCQVIIASFHWGYEYHQQPSRTQKYLGRLAVRAGAGIVLGHHPHVLQGIEFYRGGLIAYSLGNFLFDQKDSLANQSAVLHVIMKGSSLDSVWLQPLEISNKRPAGMDRGRLGPFKRLMDGLNANLGTKAQLADRRLYLYP